MTTRPTASADPTLIHASTRTSLSTVVVQPSAQVKVLLRLSRMEIRQVDGEVAVRFSGRDIDVTPRDARRRLPRHRR